MDSPTIEQIIQSPDDMIVIEGEQLRAFCDKFEKPGATWPDWVQVRAARKLLGVKRWTFLDETVRIGIGRVLGRDWYLEP